MITEEKMDYHFALFNGHKNDAHKRATQDFINEHGQDAYDALEDSWNNPPSGSGGVMALTTELQPTEHVMWFVYRNQMYVNEDDEIWFVEQMQHAEENMREQWDEWGQGTA